MGEFVSKQRAARSLRIAIPLAATLALLTAAEDDWLPFGQNASVHKTGSTVALDYKVQPGQLGLAILQTPAGKLAGMTHLLFRVKTDVTTMVGVMLSETKPGGDYTAIFWSPKDQWQQIDLTPADFNLNDGPKDPKDPDGRLDTDQVQAVAIFDGGQFFSAAADPKVPIAVTRLSGDHKLQWEDFRIVTEAGKPQAKGVVIDDFLRGFLMWFTPGGAELALSKSGNPLGKPALEFRYQQETDRFTIVMHALGQVDLRNAKELTFDVASAHDAHVLISLEAQKVDGRPAPRYNHDFTLSAGQTGHMSIPFSEFTLAEDSPPDPAGHLELGKIRSIGLMDVSGILEGGKEKNTLWLAEIRAQ